MRISRKQQTAAVLPLCGLLLFSGCASSPQPRLSADAQAGALSHFSLGLLAEAEGDSAAAFRHFESAIRLDPDATLLYVPAAALALALERTDEAVRLTRELIKRRPGEPDPQLLLARIYEGTGQPDRAEQLFRSVIRNFPGHADAPVLLARFYLSQERGGEALDVIQAASGNQPANDELLHLLGTLYIEKARTAKTPEEARETVLQGIGFLRQSITLAPDDPYRRQQLAFALLAVQKPEEAETVLLEAAGPSAGAIPLRMALGSLYLQAERYGKAYELFESVQRELPEEHWLDEPAFFLQLLIAAQKSGHPEEAAAVLLFTHENRPELFNQYLAALLTPPSPVSAGEMADLLNAVHALNPGAIEVLYYLMALEAERKEYEAALAAARLFEASVRGTEDAALLSGLFYYQYASLHERAGDLDAAEELFYKAIETGNETVAAAAQNYIAYMWAERGEKLETGLELIGKALAVEPENGAYLDTLGWIYYMQGRYTEALEKLKEALHFAADDPVILEHLGDTYMKLGDREAAVRHWKKALELDPAARRLLLRIEEAKAAEPQPKSECCGMTP